MNRKFKALLICVVAAVASSTQALQATVPSNEALKAAILKSKLLDPTIELVTTTDPANADHILVSTFLHSSATDGDCKIDALLIGKAVMESAPDVTRVTVTFFSTADFSTYKQVSVKSTDIKAFEGGAVNKELLLKNLEVQLGQTADSPSNLTALLRQTSLVKGLQVAVAGKLIELSAQVDLSRSELDAKLEALQLAQNALAAAPEGITKVNVKLQDAYEPSRVKQISFETAQLESMAGELQTALAGIAITAGATSVEVVAGPFQDERQKLHSRIDALQKGGVGVQSFLALFKFIEANVPKNDQAVLRGNIDRLSNALDDQEKTMAAVKNRPSQLKKEPEKVAIATNFVSGKKHADYTTLVDMEFDENRARGEPDRYAQELEQHYLSRPPVSAQQATHFVSGLLRISQLLKQDAKTSDADRFQKWANDVRAKYRI